MAPLKAVIREKLADLQTPVTAFLRLCRTEADSFLLESVEPHESIGRYSIIAYDPIRTIQLWPDKVELVNGGDPQIEAPDRFFDLIKETLRSHALESAPDLPAVGSVMGYVGYDAVRLIERLPPAPEIGLPAARLSFSSRYVVFDRQRRVMTLIGLSKDQAEAEAKVEQMAALLDREEDRPLVEAGEIEITPPPEEAYIEAVSRAKEYIAAGDVFQVVLADKFSGSGRVDPFQVYRLLRVKSPSPYMFFLNFGSFKIVGASPETLVKVRDGKVFLRPIAGTNARSADPVEDARLEKEMLGSEKERAEHIMLVDLARNDAGRVCDYGSVTVDPYMTVERYSHVMHIVSAVEGRLKDGADAVDAFRASFPAGTVSGAPKVRAMEIIDDLEITPRGPYSGAVGYFGPGREMDACIAIRVIFFDKDGFSVPIGAGIVADSDPALEYRELNRKAAQSLNALELAARGEL